MAAQPLLSPEPLALEINGTSYQPLLTGTPQTRGMRSGSVVLAPGADCGEHSTKSHEETLVFLRGAGIVRLVGHEPLEVGAGRIAYIPPHTTHNVVNTGAEPLAYVYVVAPVASAEGGAAAP